MLLHMQRYEYTIKYKPGKERVLANCLSHFPFYSNSLPILIAQNVQHVKLSNAEWTSFKALWSVTQCIALSIASHLEVGLSTGSKSPR